MLNQVENTHGTFFGFENNTKIKKKIKIKDNTSHGQNELNEF